METFQFLFKYSSTLKINTKPCNFNLLFLFWKDGIFRFKWLPYPLNPNKWPKQFYCLPAGKLMKPVNEINILTFFFWKLFSMIVFKMRMHRIFYILSFHFFFFFSSRIFPLDWFWNSLRRSSFLCPPLLLLFVTWWSAYLCSLDRIKTTKKTLASLVALCHVLSVVLT